MLYKWWRAHGELFGAIILWTPSRLPVDSQWTPSRLPVEFKRTPSRLPADSQRTPSRLPVDSKRTPSRLNWIPHVESSFGELFQRDHEFNWFYLSKHKIQLNFLDFSCQKANLIWKNMISKLLMLIRLISFVKTQVQIIFLNFHFKEKIQINLLDFSCQNTDANVFIWF